MTLIDIQVAPFPGTADYVACPMSCLCSHQDKSSADHNYFHLTRSPSA